MRKMKFVVILLGSFLIPFSVAQDVSSCPQDKISFEMITGYVYTAPADMLDSQPGTLMLTDCIDTCRRNSTCQSINYETGLCVLFSSSADSNGGQLTPSQFPVFTIYVQKFCSEEALKCPNAWSFERVMNHELKTEVRKRGLAQNRQDCMGLCLAEEDFICRSAMFTEANGDCRLSDMDRHTLGGAPLFEGVDGTDYLEINCVKEPRKLCVYEQTKGRILKTVDSVYQAIASQEDCRDLCNSAPFRCHSFDFNDTGDNVCRLSHHSAHTLTQIEEPYLAIEEATTYELNSCYDVRIDCHSSDMTITVETTALFDGKIYAKGSPSTCVVDVESSMNFTITMGYNDLECGVVKEGPGDYSNEVIIQHHDRIVTSADLGLGLSCQYDLTNKSVANTVDMTITGEIAPTLFEDAVVDSPNVIMRVANENGDDTKTAVVGDPLSLIFEILDQESPYEIFIRDLVALDGATSTELELIDSRGCPVDTTIMSELKKADAISPKALKSSFDAFRFPTSEMVQFRAMVTPCVPTCPPVQCDIIDYTGRSQVVDSYGRKKKRSLNNFFSRIRRSTDPQEVLVVQTLRIVDRYEKSQKKKEASTSHQTHSNLEVGLTDPQLNTFERNVIDSNVEESFESNCIDQTVLVAGGIVFLSVQICLLILWTVIWRRKRALSAKEILTPSLNGSETGSAHGSLSYLYEATYGGRRRS